MLEHATRPLTESELRTLRAALAQRRRQQRLHLRRTVISSLAIFGALCVMTLGASDAPRGYVIAFWSAIACAVGVRGYLGDRSKLQGNVRELEDALARNSARVVRIRAGEFVQFEELEDEGASYAFQFEPDRIVFVNGQDFHASAKFPNSDFSIVHVDDASGRLVEMLIAKHGAKLAPVRTISADAQREFEVPQHLATLSGRLDELESLLRAR